MTNLLNLSTEFKATLTDFSIEHEKNPMDFMEVILTTFAAGWRVLETYDEQDCHVGFFVDNYESTKESLVTTSIDGKSDNFYLKGLIDKLNRNDIQIIARYAIENGYIHW